MTPDNKMLVVRENGEGKLLFRDKNEAAPSVTYAIEIWQNLIQAGADSLPGVKDGSGGLTISDRDLAHYNEHEYILQLRDGRRVPIIITWSVSGITHSFVTSGEISEPPGSPDR